LLFKGVGAGDKKHLGHLPVIETGVEVNQAAVVQTGGVGPHSRFVVLGKGRCFNSPKGQFGDGKGVFKEFVGIGFHSPGCFAVIGQHVLADSRHNLQSRIPIHSRQGAINSDLGVEQAIFGGSLGIVAL